MNFYADDILVFNLSDNIYSYIMHNYSNIEMTGNHIDYLPHKINYMLSYYFELGVFFVVLNYICLSFMQIYAHFYKNHDFHEMAKRLEYLKNVKGIGLFTGLPGTGPGGVLPQD